MLEIGGDILGLLEGGGTTAIYWVEANNNKIILHPTWLLSVPRESSIHEKPEEHSGNLELDSVFKI